MSTAKRVASHKKYLIVTCVVFCIYTALLILPEVWLFINSFKDFIDFSEDPWALPWSLPKGIRWSNYAFIFETFDMGEAFINSFILCVTCPTATIIATTCAAYALAKFDFRGKNVLYFIHILPMLVCITGSTSTLYMFFDKLQIYDRFIGLIWSNAGGTGMNFLLVYGLFKNVSRTYMEAAEIDGASDFTVFVQIMVPQAVGIIGTLWMLGFIGCWNEYAAYQLFLPSHPTVSTRLVFIQNNVTQGLYTNHYPEFFAAIMISIIPVVAVFLAFQDQIMQMSLGGGIKG
jgi:ABC-type glycerol-3-phosphate transport system permease component